jgi:hypothetical protein
MAVKVLAGIASAENAPPAARVSAAIALLDRGWGKPIQPHTRARMARHPHHDPANHRERTSDLRRRITSSTPPRKDRAETFPLPINSARDAADVAAAIARADGHITPSEAREIGKVINVYVMVYPTPSWMTVLRA